MFNVKLPHATNHRGFDHRTQRQHQKGEDSGDLRGMWPEDPRPLSDARGRAILARTLPQLLRMWLSFGSYLLHQKRQALLQARLR